MRFKIAHLLIPALLWTCFTYVFSLPPIPIATSPFQTSIRSSLSSPNAETVMKALRKDRLQSVNFAHEILKKMDRLETNIGWSGINVERNSPAHGQLIENKVDDEGLGQMEAAIIAIKASQHLINNHCHNTNGDNRIECAKYLTQLKMTGTTLEQSCKSHKKICTKEQITAKYRSIDGTCNHIGNSTWGSSFTGYRRLLFPAYYDGVAEPRRSVNKKALPSARLVSVKLVKDIDKMDDRLTLAFMQWSQFVAHDVSHTASSKMLYSSRSVMCCDQNGNSLAPRYIHPFCLPVSIPSDDPFYSKYRMSCMSYVRSLPALNRECTFGPVDQMNQVTHYLDGSQIYGSTQSKSSHLRTYTYGLLQSSPHSHLPHSSSPEQDCQVQSNKSECYRAGDVRVNMQPHLTAMHTIWLREHNRVAQELASMNQDWDDEKLFQEARRIVIAEIQRITYKEWVPVLIGETYLKRLMGDSYDEDVDPTMSNAGATAAMRFINSLVDRFLKVVDESRSSGDMLRLYEYFNKPEVLEKPGHLDGLVRGLATQSCQKMDLDVVSDVTEKLYAPKQMGFDALSLDIQRGRDHGLPGYVEYRKFCGLPAASNFDDLKDFISKETIETFKSLYTHVSDVDLLVGGLAEIPFYDSLLGPTFTCILMEQLIHTRQGDRYFYTHKDQPSPFSAKQLEEIEKVTLASIFCQNGDNIKRMQKHVFYKIGKGNELKDCSSIPKLDLTLWKANISRK